MVDKIRKIDGSVVFFQEDKIETAIWKAVRAVGGRDRSRAEALSNEIVEKLDRVYGEHRIVDVETVQDLIEKVLIEEGHAKVGKAFILYRKSREELRDVKGLFDTIEAVDLQDDIQCKYTGGTVFHTFLGEKMTTDSVKRMVKKISNNYHLPYFTLTPTFSICPVYGYLSGEHEYCPKCDLEIAEGNKEKAEDVVAEEKMEEKLVEVAIAPEVKKQVSAFGVLDGHDSGEPKNSKLKIGGDTNGED